MTRLITLVSLLFIASSGLANEVECKIKSNKYPQLEKGEYKKAYCQDVLDSLEYNLNKRISKARLKLKITWVSSFRVGISFKLKADGNTYRGYGVQHWNPDDRFFLIKELRN